MRRKIFAIAMTLVMVGLPFFITACQSKEKDIAVSSGNGVTKIKIETTFFAIGEFARAVGGDKVDVHVIVPDGTEPHDFEPKAMDIARLSEADMFIYNGLGMESWVDKVLESVDRSSLIQVDTSKDAALIKNSEQEADEHGDFDPHIWLSLREAQKQIENIKIALVEEDPDNTDYYTRNYNDYKGKLEKLYLAYKGKFESVKNKNFVTGHAAFAYFCRDFGLAQNSVENVFAEGEPSAKRLKELVDYCRVNKIGTIFMEDMASPKISETLAREVGAKVVRISTAESSEGQLDYYECMKQNLEKIYESFK